MRRLALLLALALCAACGSQESAGEERADPEAAWLELLEGLGLEPDRDFIEVSVGGGPPEIQVVLLGTPPEITQPVALADGLYGATAYAFDGAGWDRVDTAEIRTQIAPLLSPGDKAVFRLPVREAGSYRVLVPVQGKAAWGESG
ncbi:MAG: hypothetical protein ACRDON_08355 [Gaiellaceae bacterium]